MKIAIIGGSGFIGSRLCERFVRSGINFTIVDKSVSTKFPEKTIISDVRDINSLKRGIRGDIIINLAAEHRDDITPESLYYEVNVKGAENVCEIATENGINKIIFTSSVAVYGFAPIGTDETGELKPFNEYGKTKMLAEEVYKSWLAKDPKNRTLVIVRPTVVFGEGNRGNVYNLLHHIASGRFIMIGDGKNIKSMAYVENVAAFLEFSIKFTNGLHIYNYVDKPDFDMNTLVREVSKALGKSVNISFRVPYAVGYGIGKLFDLLASVTGKKFSISSVRVKKFCSNSSFETSIKKTGFVPPVTLIEGLQRTIKYEFLEDHKRGRSVER